MVSVHPRRVGRVSATTLSERQGEHLHQTMSLVAAAHPYYSALLRQRGLSSGDFATPSDLIKLPITEKSTYMEQPEDFRLRAEQLDTLSVAERTLAQVVYTTGTTAGHPTPFYDTNHDHAGRIFQLKQMCAQLGVTPDDVIANLFPLTPVLHQGFLTATLGPMAAGAAVVSGMPGHPSTPFDIYRRTVAVIDLLKTHRPTVLWGIGSYVRHVIVQAQRDRIDLSRVRLVFLAGEPASERMRADVRERLADLGAPQVAIQNGYGFTEMQGPAIQCAEGGPFHIPTPERYFVEIVDPATHETLPDGAEGLVLISHLDRRGTILLRYAVGDLGTIAHGACPDCGVDGPRFATPPRRTGLLKKVKGTLINPQNLIDALWGVPDLVDFQIRLTYQRPGDPLSGDDLVIEVAADDLSRDRVLADVAVVARQAVEMTPTVRAAPPGFARRLDTNYKTRRLIDERAASE
jgi:phenylacetate-coenzyme A ligase PaaK-like adenylate-forming protein